ncbi:PREDICTED: uncharacterized protein LOC101303134 [Fragaria vesca subsp. vesca]
MEVLLIREKDLGTTMIQRVLTGIMVLNLLLELILLLGTIRALIMLNVKSAVKRGTQLAIVISILNVLFVIRGDIRASKCFQKENVSNNANSSSTAHNGMSPECHVALDCHHRGNYAYQGAEPPSTLFAMTAQNQSNIATSSNSQDNIEEVWIGDSRATHHMTSDLRNLHIAQPYESSNTIKIGNGEGLHVKHIGNTQITPAAHTFDLHNVLHVPSLVVNLLSFNKLCRDNHCYIIMDDVDIMMQDKASRKTLYEGKTNADGLYLFKSPRFSKSSLPSVSATATAFVGSSISSSLWHKRLGHPTSNVASKMLSLSNIKCIVHYITCPYTPQQNGVAERKNRHLVETCITLLTAASLPQHFWFHIIAHSGYLINRMPCRSLLMSSPYIQLFGSPPDLSHLKVFGLACYPFLRPYVKNKLEARTIQCVFLGYALGYKGVFCYSISKNKLWLSRHVVHDESLFPFLHVVSPKPAPISSSSFSFSKSSSIPLSPEQFAALYPSSPGIHTASEGGNLRGEIGGENVGVSNDTGRNNGDNAIFSENIAGGQNAGVGGNVGGRDNANDVGDFSLNRDVNGGSVGENIAGSENIAEVANVVADNFSNQFSGDNVQHAPLPYELQFIEDEAQSYNNHSMLTRAKNGIVKPKTFEDFCAYSCIATQNLVDELAFFSGFSSVMELHEPVEPKFFKAAAGIPE